MSGSDVEHVFCSLDSRPQHHFRRQSSSSSNERFYDAPLKSHHSDLPLVEDTLSIHDLSSEPHFAQSTAIRSLSIGASTAVPADHYFDGHDRNDRESPDPDDFYRPYPSSVVPSTETALTSSNALMVDDGSPTAEYPPSHAQRALPPATDTVTIPRGILGQYRSVSENYTGREPEPIRGAAAGASIARPRQASFKDLINKFNQNVDQVLPLPTSSGSLSRSHSRAASPTPFISGDVPGRARAPSLLRDTQNWQSAKRQPVSRWNTVDNFVEENPSESPLLPCQVGTVNQSTPKSSVPLRPPFGGLLKVDTGFQGTGLSVPSHLRRRGSEGSIPSPNPAFLDNPEFSAGLSPLTPTAWYLGRTPFLEAVSTGESSSSHNHRRVTSDLSGNWSAGAVAHSPESHMAVLSPLQPGLAVSSETSHSKSRIPLSSRRLNAAFVPEEYSSLHTDPHWNRCFDSQVPLPPKGISRLPKPSPKASPAEAYNDRTTFAMTSPRRREVPYRRSSSRPADRDALLEAYIASPLPKKSPPLRSSRPRQPVSYTTSVPPRSKVVERVSSFQKQINRDQEPRTPRSRGRRLPELGNVDFATRRQKIQQAFNRTVQENERKEEEEAELRRRVKVQEEQQYRVDAPAPEPHTNENTEMDPSQPSEDTVTMLDDSIAARHEEHQSAHEEHEPRVLPQLHIDTALATQETTAVGTEAHLMTMDSPTLGLSNIVTGEPRVVGHLPGFADDQPASAVTVMSDDTHATALDPEPQVGLSRQNLQASHRTLLSQIMQIRESSPSSSSCDEAEYSFSDNEDKESIPIVLRDAQCSEESVASSDSHDFGHALVQSSGPGRRVPNRWSISSWSSSIHNNQLTDDHCEGSGDDMSQFQQSVGDSEIATQSCSASSSTPPSVAGFQGTISLSNNDPVPEPTREAGPPRNLYTYPSAPSLARLGGWDSRRVTQLYLEELARGRGHNLPMPAIRASPEPRLDKRADGRTDSLGDDPVLISKSDDMPPPEKVGPTASLIFRDDWEHASPSIADWMQVAAGEESTPQDQVNNVIPALDGLPTPRLAPPATYQSDLEPSGGTMGLAIQVHSPQELESREAQSSLLSGGMPVEQSDLYEEAGYSQQYDEASPAAQSTQTSTRTAPPLTFSPLGPVESTGSSDDSSLRRLQATSSSHTVDSSATSLVQSTAEQSRVELSNGSPSPEQRRLKKRRHVIKELVDTEYSFGRDMKVVDDIYKGTSSSCLDLSPEDVKILFANSDQIVQFSMGFQDALKEAARSVYVMPKSQRWSSKRSTRNTYANPSKTDSEAAGAAEVSDTDKDKLTFIGQAFLAHIAPMGKVYGDYLKNHDAANKKLQVLQRNPKVAIWLKECREWASDLTTAWDLDSLLVKPVQRILKYPLLLSELLDSTPNDHPDRTFLMSALEEVTNISVRINEMKKRADLVGQVVGRKRKESDVRTGLSKAFGRRTEKLRQQVGLSDMFEDKEYDTLSQRFGDNFFQLQVVMRDVEMYTREIQGSMERFSEFVAAIEGVVDVTQSGYLDVESRWRELKSSVQDIMTGAFPEHLAIVRKSVIDPMVTLLKLYDGPQRVMKKRDKRLMDHARFKSIKDRGDKPDKKTTEQSEQFVALNETLKDELPKLYSLTAKLMETCLKNFVQIQTTWFNIQQKKIAHLVDSFPDDLQNIISDWSANFTLAEAQILSLGMCNGSLLADTINLVNFNTPSTAATISSPRRPSTVNSTSTRMESPKASHDFGNGGYSFQSPSLDAQSQRSFGRHRADSIVSGRAAPETSEIPRSQLLQQITNTSSGSGPSSTNPYTESFPSLPRLSLDSPFLVDVMGPSAANQDQGQAQEQHQEPAPENPPASPVGRYSGFFSSAMPMSDNPQDDQPAQNVAQEAAPKEPTVLFLAASIYEFNIDRARREAGYPYLTYVAGEIFDVIAEKGELWLAKNQDDPTRQVGWIWNKHFAKLSS
ncbi:putative Rho guanyl nucleotide exchange factor [Aspergillus clavatus NRRL 1]|uniref:Dynamin-binding protein n=1 Tax=Aspergillus clavatus (strain ATCC 1007 / CBS 513.65 / DSM 816 / NCTC 3887 / NRRL 1 / QM 1276 / 107) TaxID=344612 RepID=A1CDE5_ASPCL|nr:Rho guanyl nucleotide exchange factor, putative [Aspergillus clavatus NRRL 1]EAW11872.1 Rho guanyl nucleotide exchange factor, putative [Aspergillus clavatus NRRL 1]